MKRIALIVAGGKGDRMKSDIPKQFIAINKLPILMHTIKQFSHLDEIVLVLPQDQFKFWEDLCKEYNFNEKYSLVEGGKSRFHSVQKGLQSINKDGIIAIHDGVRPLISKNLIDNLTTQVKEGFGVIPVIPISDSVRKIENGVLKNTQRSNLYKVQTPQCFLNANIQKAYKQKYSHNFTDDASVFESNGGAIKTILGDIKNMKITTSEDLKMAGVLM